MAQLHSSAIYCITRERPPICTACMLCSFWVSVYTAENQQIKVMWTYKFIKTKVCATISSIQTCIPTCTKGVGRHQYILRLCNHDYYNYSKVRSLYCCVSLCEEELTSLRCCGETKTDHCYWVCKLRMKLAWGYYAHRFENFYALKYANYASNMFPIIPV